MLATQGSSGFLVRIYNKHWIRFMGTVLNISQPISMIGEVGSMAQLAFQRSMLGSSGGNAKLQREASVVTDQSLRAFSTAVGH